MRRSERLRVLVPVLLVSSFALALSAALPVRALPEGSKGYAVREHEGLASEALFDYLRRPDDSYRWKVRARTEVLGTRIVELRLVSQTWNGIPWKHGLLIATPRKVQARTGAVLAIGGGAWKDRYDDPDGGFSIREERLDYLAQLAESMGMPVAYLSHVPFQPMFGGLDEDDLIAHTFIKFVETGDSSWPLLLPMVKAAHRAMDTVQDYLREAAKVEVDGFVVGGASKRGWTTWLTGATDARVKGIVPMVIDVLNMAPQMQHQRETFGAYSEEISEYSDRGLQELLGSPAGQSLTAIVDPYSYRSLLALPKLIVLGANDRYWATDALNLYWDGLPGEKHVLYVPNAGHNLNESGVLQTLASCSLFVKKVLGGGPFPSLRWEFQEDDRGLTLALWSEDLALDSVRFWVAGSGDRDFRDETWRTADGAQLVNSVRSKTRSAWRYALPRPSEGYAAVFGEATFDVNGDPVYLSTNLRIIGPEGSAGRPRGK